MTLHAPKPHSPEPHAAKSHAADQQPVLEIDSLTAVHGQGRRLREVLSPTSLGILPGESVAVVGRSGAGKSTLADIVLGLRAPSGGSVRVLGEDWCARDLRPQRRHRHLVQGVPQDPAAAFVPRWTLRRSIEQAVRRLAAPGTDGPGAGTERGIESRIRAAVDMASLDPALLDRRPAEISGGQAQRAALARALAVNPAVIVADEPTSALDPDTAASVSAALLSLVAEAGVALLLVTHDPVFAARCTRTITLTAPKESP